jgi:hypothetical protein
MIDKHFSEAKMFLYVPNFQNVFTFLTFLFTGRNYFLSVNVLICGSINISRGPFFIWLLIDKNNFPTLFFYTPVV